MYVCVVYGTICLCTCVPSVKNGGGAGVCKSVLAWVCVLCLYKCVRMGQAIH